MSSGGGRTTERLLSVAFKAYVWLVIAFIAVPLLLIVSVSVTPERFMSFPPGGISSRWYVEFATSATWTSAFTTSLLIALGAAFVSTSIGGVLAFALDRYDYNYRALMAGFGMLPILLPPVILGVAFFVFFLAVGFTGSTWNVILAHGIFYAPFPFLLISQGLDELDRGYEEAAMDLGAGPVKTLRTVTVPLINANIFSGAMFAFILSLNEYIIAWLLSGFVINTIPIELFTSLRSGYSPVIAAVSVIFIGLTVVVMTIIDRTTGGIWE
ncbi:ABC transporter permease [Haloferacaceae archaeon DSL9]